MRDDWCVASGDALTWTFDAEDDSPRPAPSTNTTRRVLVIAFVTMLIAEAALVPWASPANRPLVALAVMGGAAGFVVSFLLRRSRHERSADIGRDTSESFTLRMSTSELVVSGARSAPSVIAIERIDRFIGDDQSLRVLMRDATTAALPCTLGSENGALATSLNEALALQRAKS